MGCFGLQLDFCFCEWLIVCVDDCVLIDDFVGQLYFECVESLGFDGDGGVRDCVFGVFDVQGVGVIFQCVQRGVVVCVILLWSGLLVGLLCVVGLC